MSFNDPIDILISLRLLAGAITLSFTALIMLRLVQQYRSQHYSQSIYLLAMTGSIFLDSLARLTALIVFHTTAPSITPSSMLFLAGQWVVALGVMLFALFLTGLVNGFWDRKHKNTPESILTTLPNVHR